MTIRLISFKTCPYVQRAVITLLHKQIEFEIVHVDLDEPPGWFLEMSPLKKVPVLEIDGEVLFESAVINEYLDDITGGELQPKNPLARARNRAWIEFASNMLGCLYRMKMSQDESAYRENRAQLEDMLLRVEDRLGDGPWFDGGQFSLCDTAFAPFFRQDCVFDGRLSVLDQDSMPKTVAWASRLLDLPEVRNSVVAEFEDLYLAAMRRNGSYSLCRLAA